MTAVTFDTLSIAKRLKLGGFSESQAEALAHEIQEVSVEEHLVTRDFLRGELGKVRSEIESKIENGELRIVIRLGGMIVALGAILIAIKYFG